MMNRLEILQIILSLGTLVLCAPILGRFFAHVYNDEQHLLKRPLGWLERICKNVVGANYDAEMDWKKYAKALLLFNLIGLLFTFIIQLIQAQLPLNPQALPNVPWHLALNTAISFVTNTNWQSYAGETTLSYLVQMIALTVQNFVSAATGMAVAVALARGISKKNTNLLGNFWKDMVRGTVYILLPFSLLLSTALISQGVVQTFLRRLKSSH